MTVFRSGSPLSLEYSRRRAQQYIAFHATSAASNSAFLISALLAHSNSFLPALFKHEEAYQEQRSSSLEHHTNEWYGSRSTSLWVTGTSSGNCQESETRVGRACHSPRKPLQHHLPGHLGGRATPWSSKKMPDGQRQRADIPAHARTTNNGLLHIFFFFFFLKWKRISAKSSPMSPRRPSRSRN